MREMVLNHASLARATRTETDAWLKDIVAGIAALVRFGVVQEVLRTDRPAYEIPCPAGRSLGEAWDGLRREVRQRPEETRLLGRLLTKVPILYDASSEPGGRLSTCQAVRCEAKTLPPSGIEFGPDSRYDLDAGRPLVYCAIAGEIAVSFPSERVWKGDRVTVVFDERFRDGETERAREEVDNLSRSEDASTIGDRCRKSLEFPRSSAEVWCRRKQLFPNLMFGMDVEGNMMQQAGLLSTIVRRLRRLDAMAREWKLGGDSPRRWPGVTDESNRVKDNPKLREERRFRSRIGERLLFEWHARVGGGVRVHLRFDESKRDIEIGYVGNKLPTALFPK